jgi:endo-1,4-beta-xylanase
MKKMTGFFLILVLLNISCQTKQIPENSEILLKDVYKDTFMIGTALNSSQINGDDSESMTLVKKHFNSITAENILKWAIVHPEPDRYNFDQADAFVSLGKKNNMFIVGHTLVWHNQTPDWVFTDNDGKPVDRKKLLNTLREHIFSVAGRYKGQINGWDVVNEAIDEEGSFRSTHWFEIVGLEFIEKAFQWAHEADPQAELYYNDYNMWYEGKREAVIKLVQRLQSQNIPIHGIGLQGHWGLDYPGLKELDESLQKYTETGLKIMVTELDINVLPFPNPGVGADITQNIELRRELNPYENGLPDSMQVRLSDRYRDIFKILIKYKKHISRVTFWGVHDGVSWTNYWPVRGRTNYPLLFDRNYQPKPAFHEIIQLVDKK